MAAKDDLLLSATLDLSGYIKKLDEMVTRARSAGKLIADALGAASLDSTAAPSTGGGSSRSASAKKEGDERKALSRSVAEEEKRIMAQLVAEERALKKKIAEEERAIMKELLAEEKALKKAAAEEEKRLAAELEAQRKRELEARKRAIEEGLRAQEQAAAKEAAAADARAKVRVASLGVGIGAAFGRGAAPGGAPGGGKGTASAAQQAQAQILAAEMRNAQFREQLEAQTDDEIIDLMADMQARKKDLLAAERRETDRHAKSLITGQRKQLEEELGLVSENARKRKSVQNEGAGVGVGLLGIGRKLLTGQLEGIEKDFRKVTGGGALAFNQVAQNVSLVSDALTTLSTPTVALDKVTQQIKTLGDEAAAMAPGLRDSALALASSGDFEFDASEIQQAMFDALASGVKGGEDGLKSFAETASKLATGGGAELNQAVSLLAGQLNAYGKSSEDAGKFADIFFNTVNLGVTSVGELSAQLSNVIPTAAGLGIEIENVGASLAFMTSRGIPTAQSTTKLNALLLELAKPGAALAPILKQAGVSLESLKQDDLPVTLQKVQTALASTGKAAVEVFSSSEAGAAFQTLTGDLVGFADTFKQVRDTTGSTENAYTQMSDSISFQTKAMLASVNGFITEGLGALSNGFLATIQASAQFAPMIQSLSGLKTLIPPSIVGTVLNFAKGLVGAMIPALASTTAAQTAAGTAGASMWAAIAGPLLPIIAGIGLIVGAVAILYNSFAEVEAAIKGLWAGIVSVFDNAGDILGAFLTGGPIEGMVALGRTFGDALTTEFKKTLTEAEIEDALEDLGEALNTAVEGKGKANAAKGLDELVAKYNAAKTDIERNAIAEQIAEGFPDAVNEVEKFNEATGKVEKQFTLNSAAAKKFSADLKDAASTDVADAQEDAVIGLKAQLQVLEQQKASVTDLEKKLASQKALGIDTAETQRQLDEAKGAVEKAQADIFATLDTGKATGIFDNLEGEAKTAFDGMKDKLQPVLTDWEQQAATSRIGENLAEAAKLKGNLDANDALGGLVKKFENAKTDVEKQQIAQAIASQVPQAVTQFDEMGNAIGINTKKVDEFVAAQKKGFSGDLESKRKAFGTDLKLQADQLAATRDKAAELQQKIVEYNAEGKDATALREELVNTTKKADEQAAAFGQNIKKGKEFGLVKGDVNQVAKEFGFTTKQTNAAALGIKKMQTQTVDAKDAAADLAAEFANMRSAVDKSVSDNLAKIALVRIKDAFKEEVTKEERDQAEEARKALGQAISRQKQFNSIYDNLQIQFGLKERERRGRQQRDLSHLDRELQLQEAKNANRLAAIQSDYLREVTAAQFSILIAERRFNVEKQKLAEERLQAASITDASERTSRIRAIDRQIKDAGRAFTVEKKGLDEALERVLEAGKATIGEDLLGVGDTIARSALDVRQRLNDALSPVDGRALDLATLRQQGEERVRIIREQGELAILEATTQSQLFKERSVKEAQTLIDRMRTENLAVLTAQQALADEREKIEDENRKRIDNDQAELTEAEVTARLQPLLDAERAASETVAATNTEITASFAKTRSDMASEFGSLALEQIKNLPKEQQALAYALLLARVDAERAAAVAAMEERKKVRAAELAETLKGVDTVAEQEKLTALAALEDELDEKRTLYKGNAAQLEAIERDGARRRYEIEVDHQKKTNKVFQLYLDIRDALIDAFDRKQEDKRKEELQKKKDELVKEEQDLFSSFARRLISYQQFNDRLTELADKRREIEAEKEGEQFDFDQQIKEAGIIAATKYGERISGENEKVVNDYYAAWEAARGTDDKNDEESKAKKAARQDAFDDLLFQSASNGIAAFAQLAAEGERLGDAALVALIDMAMTFLDAMIPVWIAGAYGTSVAQMGPLGLAIAAGLVGVVHGLAAAAKGALAKAKGAATGEIDIDGPGTATSDSLVRRVSRTESIITGKGTHAGRQHGRYGNKEILREANKGRSILDIVRPYFASQVEPVVSLPIARPELSNLVYDVTRNVIRPVHEETKMLRQRVAQLEAQQTQPAGPSRPAPAPKTPIVHISIDGQRVTRASIRRG